MFIFDTYSSTNPLKGGSFSILFCLMCFFLIFNTGAISAQCIDVDPPTLGGYTYEIVQIGDQCWFAENLRYDNGCTSVNWVSFSDVGWCGCFNNSQDLCNQYGLLYQWSAAMDGSTEVGAQGICPEGWRIPTDDDWKILEGEVDSQFDIGDPIWNQEGYRGSDIGSQLAYNSSLWTAGELTADPAFEANDVFGALPAGYRYISGAYWTLHERAHFWNSNHNGDEATYRLIRKFSSQIYRGDIGRARAFSIRCVFVPCEESIEAAGIGGNTQICEGESTELSVIGGFLGDEADWEWYTDGCGENHIGSGNTIVVAPNENTIYYVRAEGLCNTTECVQVTVTVNQASLPPVAILGEQEICQGDNVHLSVQGGQLGTNANWEWYSGACGENHEGSGNSIIVSPSQTISYFVRAEGNCNTTECVEITIIVMENPEPNPYSNSPICEGEELLLFVDDGFTWEWEGPDNFSDNVQNPVLHPASVASGGIYTVTVTNVNGCTNSGITNVSIDENSIIPDSIVGDNIVCPGETGQLFIIGGHLGTDAEWEWFTGGCGENPEGTGENINVNPLQETTYYVYATGKCNTTECVSITVNMGTESTMPIRINGNNELCQGESSELWVEGGSLGTGANWQWYSGECGGTHVGTGESITINPMYSTNYFVRAEGLCNITECVYITVIVYQTPQVNAQNSGPYCEGDLIQLFTADAGEGATYLWEGPNDFSSSDQNPGIFNATINMTGIYTVSVTLGTCSSTSSTSVSVYDAFDVNIENAGPICYGYYSIQLSATPPGGIWSGDAVNNSGVFNVAEAGKGNHSVIYSVTDGCVVTAEININVYYAFMNVEYEIYKPLCLGGNDGKVYFIISQGSPPYIISWDENQYSTDQVATGLEAGSYIFTITDAEKCIYVVSDIFVDEGLENCINIPNAFTPNGDGINDYWIIENIEFFPRHLIQVFNRWGQEVYSGRHGERPWDGTYNNKPLPTGSYIYIVNLNNEDRFVGIVSLVR